MNTLEELRQRIGDKWKRSHGGFKKGTRFNQNDLAKIQADDSFCVGVALTISATAVNGLIGDNYPTMIYSGAKRRREEKRGEMDASGGLSIEEGADYAMKMFGAKSGPFRLRTLADIISWLQISPVVIGFEWTAGMENPHTKGGVWGFFFGSRWIKPDKEDRKKIKYGNHAVAITGASFKKGGYVRVQNSRGMNWGNKGTARLAWSDLEDMLRRRKAIAYGIEWNERGNTRAEAKAALATHEPS